MLFLSLALVLASMIPVEEEQYCGKLFTYEQILDEARADCKNSRYVDVREDILETLVETEKRYNVPNNLRGMLLASACSESGFNPKARGDRKFSKDGKKALAVGLFQMWPWWENPRYGYGIDREDPEESSEAYLKHITKQLHKVKKNCGFKNERRLWVAAWVHAIRKPKKGGRCFEKPKHLRTLNRWHKNIRKYCDSMGC